MIRISIKDICTSYAARFRCTVVAGKAFRLFPYVWLLRLQELLLLSVALSRSPPVPSVVSVLVGFWILHFIFDPVCRKGGGHGPRCGNDFWGQRANNFATLATDPRSVVVVVVLLPLCFLGKRYTRERAFRCYLHYCHREHITIKVGSRHHQAAAAASWVGSSVPVLLPISVVRRGRAPRAAFGS